MLCVATHFRCRRGWSGGHGCRVSVGGGSGGVFLPSLGTPIGGWSLAVRFGGGYADSGGEGGGGRVRQRRRFCRSSHRGNRRQRLGKTLPTRPICRCRHPRYRVSVLRDFGRSRAGVVNQQREKERQGIVGGGGSTAAAASPALMEALRRGSPLAWPDPGSAVVGAVRCDPRSGGEGRHPSLLDRCVALASGVSHAAPPLSPVDQQGGVHWCGGGATPALFTQPPPIRAPHASNLGDPRLGGHLVPPLYTL